MKLNKLVFLFVIVFITPMFQNALASGRAERFANELKLISANRDSENFLSLVVLMLGKPEKVFRYFNYDVWFYPVLSTSLINRTPYPKGRGEVVSDNKSLKNVYIFFKKGKLIFVRTCDQSLNPYTEFDVSP